MLLLSLAARAEEPGAYVPAARSCLGDERAPYRVLPPAPGSPADFAIDAARHRYGRFACGAFPTEADLRAYGWVVVALDGRWMAWWAPTSRDAAPDADDRAEAERRFARCEWDGVVGENPDGSYQIAVDDQRFRTTEDHRFGVTLTCGPGPAHEPATGMDALPPQTGGFVPPKRRPPD